MKPSSLDKEGSGADGPPRSAPRGVRMMASFAAIYGIWGSTYLAIRYALEGLPPLTMTGIRFVVAGLLLYGWGRWLAGERPRLAHWRGAISTRFSGRSKSSRNSIRGWRRQSWVSPN